MNSETDISDIMSETGVPIYIKGYGYLRKSVSLVVNNSELIYTVRK